MTIKFGPDGITMDDKMMNLSKGWFILYNDGTMVTEDDTDWYDVDRSKILALGLKWYDRFWTINGRTAYLQFKRGSVVFSPDGSGSDIQCEERCIGYYEGENKVIFRVNERTGQMTPGVQVPNNGRHNR